ncbi:dienelactone hydrolase family protein [Turneriella parva]|uniref:Dienelactone hydrolase n=1 Tax=Turneriella parva (strain ATCC BAA-1111 / DSM 21527 / NCTC 11395 / H) TaxID=869212 RepID=I4B0Y4_TURPD|nr:dienelactone hydrolase family protein [Turneriella parva]AFM10941.1 dienelactone hydrolase [Turneriella parva DSM 21527]
MHTGEQIALSNRTITAHIFRAAVKEAPAVIFLPDLTGVGETQLETAALLSGEGFTVVVPDLFSEQGAARYCLRMFFDAAFLTNQPGNQGVTEVFELIEHVKRMPGIDAGRIGLIGQCLTGGFALHAALRDDIKAPVVFHHSFGLTGSGIPELSGRAICKPVQGHFVQIDPMCPKSRVEQLRDQLGTYLEVNYYDWLPHGIPHFFRRTDEGRRAYINMVRFLKMQLAI